MSALLLSGARQYGGGDPLDILLSDGAIAAVGAVGSVDVPSGAERVDVAGRYVGPGLWDHHVHFTQWVIQRQRFDLSGTHSAADVLDRVRAALADYDPERGGLLTGYGFRDGLWPDAPTRAALDEIAPDVPVVLISGDLHCGWLNSRTAQLAGLEVPDSGILSETEWIGALAGFQEQSALTLDDYREAAEAAAQRGVVGIVEFENTDNASEWPARVDAGVRSLRVETSVWPDRLERAIADGLRTGQVLDPHGLVTMGPLKVVVDGSLNTRTALCWDPYPGLDPFAPHACGVASVPVAELRSLLERARDNGLSGAVHAIGDRANSEVLDTFEELGMRGVIEHAQLVDEGDFERFARLGMIASVQPEHAMDDRDVADHHWEGRTGRAFAFGSLHAAGAELRLGSDAPVAPLDPWQAIASATSRSREDREPWHPEQRLPLEVALASSSRGRAGIVVGEVADLVIVDIDPLTATRDELRRMPVAATLLGGRFTWSTLAAG